MIRTFENVQELDFNYVVWMNVNIKDSAPKVKYFQGLPGIKNFLFFETNPGRIKKSEMENRRLIM
jgi:hypothetical protein